MPAYKNQQNVQDDSQQYQDEILKVKQIWNDIKSCDKVNKNLQKKQPNKDKSNIKAKQKNKYQKNINKEKSSTDLHHSHKTKQSKNITKNIFDNKNQIIQFSTIRQPYNSYQQYNTSKSKYNLSTDKKNSQIKNNSSKDKKKLINTTSCNDLSRQNKKQYYNSSSSYCRNYTQEIHELKGQVQNLNKQISVLRVYNQRYKDVINRLQRQINQKDVLIKKINQKQQQLLATTHKQFYNKNNKQFQSTQNNIQNDSYKQNINMTVQYLNYKKDCKRLLKMLQSTSQYQYFANFALQDQNIRFLHSVNSMRKTHIDMINNNNKNQQGIQHIHFCSCNKQYLPLKQEQNNLWVPQKIYEQGRKFIQQRKGEQISWNQIQLLLYQMNRMWRQRQKKIVNRLKSQNSHQVKQFKRKTKQIQYQKQHHNVKKYNQ